MSRINSPVLFLFIFLLSRACSHQYEGDTLDLSTYQWNMWVDTGAVWPGDRHRTDSLEMDNSRTGSADVGSSRTGSVIGDRLPEHPPSCGWEELHLGIGTLVRIPAAVRDHFSPGSYTGVAWFHVRYTLPDLWEDRQIVLQFDSAGVHTEVYLHKQLVGYHRGAGEPFEVDITPTVYYTRDNHLDIRIADPFHGRAGMGNITLSSSDNPE